MKLFLLNTRSESMDYYCYIIQSPKLPTSDEIKAFLIKNSRDKDEEDHILYESPQELIEMDAREVLVIPKINKAVLVKWNFL